MFRKGFIIWVFPKIVGLPPNHPLKNMVFLETPICVPAMVVFEIHGGLCVGRGNWTARFLKFMLAKLPPVQSLSTSPSEKQATSPDIS